jgi:hypothetical protein
MRAGESYVLPYFLTEIPLLILENTWDNNANK